MISIGILHDFPKMSKKKSSKWNLTVLQGQYEGQLFKSSDLYTFHNFIDNVFNNLLQQQ